MGEVTEGALVLATSAAMMLVPFQVAARADGRIGQHRNHKRSGLVVVFFHFIGVRLEGDFLNDVVIDVKENQRIASCRLAGRQNGGAYRERR